MRGVFPILQTPFDSEGRIVIEDLRSEVEFAVRSGVHGVGIAFGSEIIKLDEHEREQVLGAVVDQANGRIEVVMNAGAPSTHTAVHYCRVAKVLGADAVMIAPPTVTGVPEALVKQYYLDIAGQCELPIFMQDVTGASLQPELMAELSREAENLNHAKIETLPTPPRFTATAELAGDRLSMFGGANGVHYVEEMRCGASGTMQGIAICDVVRQVWDLFEFGDDPGVAELWDKYQPLVKLYTAGGGASYWVAKEIMRRRGVISDSGAFPRAPARKPDDGTFDQIGELMDRLEIGAG